MQSNEGLSELTMEQEEGKQDTAISKDVENRLVSWPI